MFFNRELKKKPYRKIKKKSKYPLPIFIHNNDALLELEPETTQFSFRVICFFICVFFCTWTFLCLDNNSLDTLWLTSTLNFRDLNFCYNFFLKKG